jgi:hypothetical protein
MIDEPKPHQEEGGMPSDDAAALKKALETERTARKELEKLLKGREKAEEEAKAAKEREDLEKRGEYEKIRAADQAALKKAHEEIESLRASIRKGAIARAATEAISAHNGIPKALEPHLSAALEAVGENEDLRVVAVGDPGKTASDLVATWKKSPDWAWAFHGSGASGSGSPPVKTGVLPTNETISPVQRLNRAFGTP